MRGPLRLHKFEGSSEATVTIYERDDNISFLSCGIYLYLGGKVNHLEDMFYSSPETLAKLGAMVRTKHNVLKLTPSRGPYKWLT